MILKPQDHCPHLLKRLRKMIFHILTRHGVRTCQPPLKHQKMISRCLMFLRKKKHQPMKTPGMNQEVAGAVMTQDGTTATIKVIGVKAMAKKMVNGLKARPTMWAV